MTDPTMRLATKEEAEEILRPLILKFHIDVTRAVEALYAGARRATPMPPACMAAAASMEALVRSAASVTAFSLIVVRLECYVEYLRGAVGRIAAGIFNSVADEQGIQDRAVVTVTLQEPDPKAAAGTKH